MKNLLLTTILLSSLLIPSAALAAPDKYTDYVMSEPVSLHDFAVYQMNNKLEGIFEVMFFKPYGDFTHENLGCYMSYDFDSNLYNIFIVGGFGKGLKGEKAQYDLADKLIHVVKFHLGFLLSNDEKKYTLDFHKSSLLSRLMFHSGYTELDAPKNLAQEIDKKIRIRLKFRLPKDKIFECVSTDILSPKVMCSSE